MTDQPSPPSNRRTLGCLLEVVETLALTAILFWVIQSFVAQPFQVQQKSMMDTIQDGQFVLVDRLTPRFDPYHRGDIVVFAPPKPNSESPEQKPFIKRVIGVARDTVELRDGVVFVNDVALDEPYVFAVDGVAQPTTQEDGNVRWVVPDGMLFVMGDHRAQSSDSRAFGPIEVSSVVGRAWLRYWPLAAFSILPTASHPELASPSASPKPSPKATAKPTAKPKPTRTPRP